MSGWFWCNCKGTLCQCEEKRVYRKPLYVAKDRGISWSVMEQDASRNHFVYLLHNLEEWQARAIAAILNGGAK